MGNLCSSGAEREKKEENQLPDKPRDGEDEALLPKAEGAAVELSTDGVQVTSSRENGAGLPEALGEVVTQEKANFSELSGSIAGEGQLLASQGQSAFTRVLQSGKDGVDKSVEDVKAGAASAAEEAVTNSTAVVEDVKTAVEEALTSAVATTQDAAAGGVEKVKENVESVVQQVTQKAADVTDGVSSSVSNVAEDTVGVVDSTKDQVSESVTQSIDTSVTESTNQLLTSADIVVNEIDNVARETEAKADLETIDNDANQVASEIVDGSSQRNSSLLSDTEKSLQEQILDKFDELKMSALISAENGQQTADETVAEVVKSVEESVTQTSAAVSESGAAVSKEVVEVSQEAKNEAEQSLGQVVSSVESAVEKVEAEVQEEAAEAQTTAVTSAENVSGEISGVISGGCQTLEASSKRVEDVAENAFDAVSDSQQQLKDEASQAVTDAVDATVSTVEAAEKDVVDAGSNVQQQIVESVGQVTDNVDVNSGLLDNVLSTVQCDLQAGIDSVQQQIVESCASEAEQDNVHEDKTSEEAEDQSANNTDNVDEPSFLEKAKSLLDAHRNSLDESKTVILESVGAALNADEKVEEAVSKAADDADKNVEDVVSPRQESLEDSEAADESGTTAVNETAVSTEENSEAAADAAQETARDFVESIIEKATSLVAESLSKGETEEETSTSSEVSVERGEETLEPKKRGVMFASPQRSEQSSSPLSSPPEFSPPLVMEDLSPPSDSTNSSSLSQNESADKEELFSSAPSAPTLIYQLNENNNNDNLLNNNTEDDDESFQRVAMEVTTKAVQEAIKIVTENGTGSFLSNPELSNDLGLSSPSSPENDDEEEMTTTDSSQVERGSPVSDITDTSAQGSVSESLSSYDPGAVFRQDVANLSDLVTSPIDNVSPSESTSAGAEFPAVPANALVNNDLINFEDSCSSQANTPTNAAHFDNYPSPSAQDAGEDLTGADEVNPPLAPTSEVPSSLSFDDDFAVCPGKPTIIINSPDSAHHTNGSAEDLTTSQRYNKKTSSKMGTKFSKFTETVGKKFCTPNGGCESSRSQNNCETGHDPAIHGAKLEDRNYNNDGFKKKPGTGNDQQQNNAAVMVQTQYRQHTAKEEVQELRREQAAIKIQSGFRGYVDREHVRKMRTEQEHGKKKKDDIDLNDPDVEKAAIFIQSGFKGFKTRQKAQELLNEEFKKTQNEGVVTPKKKMSVDPDKAAAKIQAGFKGFLVRKEIRQSKQQNRRKSRVPSVDSKDPHLDKAATKIQASFRGHLVRKSSKQQSVGQEDQDMRKAMDNIQSGFKGMKVREEEMMDGEKYDEDVNTSENHTFEPETDQDAGDVIVDEMHFDDSSADAAVKIQAGFRGYRARKHLKEERGDEMTEEDRPVDAAETSDLDYNSPDAEKAATTIQAGFRGFKARKELHEEHVEVSLGQDDNEADAGDLMNLENPEMELAAVKIQAGFKGMKARREVKVMRSEKESHDDGEAVDNENGTEVIDDQTEDTAEVLEEQESENQAGDVVEDEQKAGEIVTDESAVDDRVADEPMGEEQVIDGQKEDDQVTDEQTGDDQLIDKPIDDQQTDEATLDDQQTEEATEDDKVTDEPAVDDQTA
ncbi:hypothetical protein Btru_037730 [Bulinus truncatus]|nr:hypothetical protein Btru_037730 [Bulinus truncatus]